MIYLVVVLISISVVLLVMGVGAAVTGQGRVVRQRLDRIRTGDVSREAEARRQRTERREALQGMLEALADRMRREESPRYRGMRSQLLQAGYRGTNVVGIYLAVRVLLMAGLGVVGLLMAALFVPDASLRLVAIVFFGLLGWMLPFMVLKRKIAARKRELQRGLADALDIMVVCVEAGLGVNQALIRVAEEMDRVNPAISDELTMVTLEMRAGTPRSDALKNMAARTENDDIRSWANMMIQTDRFGTSIADSLRIHSETLRDKRHQRAQEAAAKLSVKMIIPLVLFVFPAMFIVILGPVMIIMIQTFADI